MIVQSLSRDGSRLDSARRAMVDLQRRLKETGIHLDDRFTRFPDRLAELRKDANESKKDG